LPVAIRGSRRRNVARTGGIYWHVFRTRVYAAPDLFAPLSTQRAGRNLVAGEGSRHYGLTARFVQNRTLSGKQSKISGCQKRSFAHYRRLPSSARRR